MTTTTPVKTLHERIFETRQAARQARAAGETGRADLLDERVDKLLDSLPRRRS